MAMLHSLFSLSSSVALNTSNPTVKSSAMAAASVEGSKRKIPYPNTNWVSSDKTKYEPSKLGSSKFAIPPASSRIPKAQPSLRPLQPSSFKSALAQSKSSAKPSVKNPENEEDTSLELFEKELIASMESMEEGHENCDAMQPFSLKSETSQSKPSAGATVQNLEDEEDISLELFERELVDSFGRNELDPENCEPMQPSSLQTGPSQSKSSAGVTVKNVEDEENISLESFKKGLNDFVKSEEQDKYSKSVPSSKTKSSHDSLRVQTPASNLVDCPNKKVDQDAKNRVNIVQDKDSSVRPSLHEQADKKKPQFVSNINGSSRKVLNQVDKRANNLFMNGIGRPGISRPLITKGAAVKGGSASATAPGKEERYRLVPMKKLACGKPPKLQEEMKRAQAQGRQARIKFGAENVSDSVIEVGKKQFKDELLQSGYVSRKLNVERVLDESVKNGVKMRTEEAERKLKARHL